MIVEYCQLNLVQGIPYTFLKNQFLVFFQSGQRSSHSLTKDVFSVSKSVGDCKLAILVALVKRFCLLQALASLHPTYVWFKHIIALPSVVFWKGSCRRVQFDRICGKFFVLHTGSPLPAPVYPLDFSNGIVLCSIWLNFKKSIWRIYLHYQLNLVWSFCLIRVR